MDEFFAPHPSGVGVMLFPPFGHYRFWRDPGPELIEYELDELGEIVRDVDDQPKIKARRRPPVLSGFAGRSGQRYLDWEVPVDGPVTYWLECSEDGVAWREVARETFELEPTVHYSALEDGGLYDVTNPRDALVVHLGVRLAGLAREGALYVRSAAHRRRYNVTAAGSFGEAETPVIGVSFDYGTGESGDMAGSFFEERLKIKLTAFSFDKRERDSLTLALRGLMGEIAWFLEDLGCDQISYGELSEKSQVGEPYGYITEMAIAMTAYTFMRMRQGGWQLVPVTSWSAEPDSP